MMDSNQTIRNDLILRVPLAEVIPLRTPFRLGIDVANGCNLKCAFCFHSIEASDLSKKGFKPTLMALEAFANLLRQIQEFSDNFKSITFGGVGEPLLHKDLPRMVQLLKNSKKADKVSIVTNATLLNEELSAALINAGLDEIIISVEALSTSGYLALTGAPIDFDQFIHNIGYFYANKGQCKVYSKAVDASFNEENAEAKFHRLFDDISDLAFVESIVPRYKDVDYTKINHTNDNLSLRHKTKADVCSIPFYSLSIFPSGNVGPCCLDYSETIVLGNFHDDSLLNIWNGEQLRQLQLAHLRKSCAIPICQGCKFTQHNGRIEDIIDDSVDKLINKILKSR